MRRDVIEFALGGGPLSRMHVNRQTIGTFKRRNRRKYDPKIQENLSRSSETIFSPFVKIKGFTSTILASVPVNIL